MATNEIAPLIKRWQQQRLVTVLAEPNLVTVSGRPAQFHVGGEFPIKFAQRNGKLSIQFRKYGTLVDVAPTVLDDGRIHLELRPSVRRINSERTVLINGTEVPGLSVREVDFAVELAEGQTVVVGGITNVPRDDRKVDRDDADPAELIVLATVEIADAPDIAAQPRGRAAPATTRR